MNLRYVLRQLGLVMLVLALCMGLTAGVEYILFGGLPSERMSALALLMGGVIAAVSGAGCWLAGRRTRTDLFNRRDALLLVSLSWFVGAALAAVPFYAWVKLGGVPLSTSAEPHPFADFISCYFESMSGLTTTGATVLGAAAPTGIESLPKGLLLWRAFTHWLGGLGIVVLFVAVLPVVGVGGKKLFQIEAPGPKAQGVRPRIRETVRVLWLIYLVLTVAQIFAYRIAGMEWFDATCHTFATLSTGGFSTRNASIGAYYANPAIDWITIAFMLLAGVNFGLYYQLANRRLAQVWADRELRLYLAILGVATAVIAVCLYGQSVTLTTGDHKPEGLGRAVRDSVFQVVSIQSTTGFATVDFNLWGFLPKAILISLMFIGGCAGSTGGGIKVIRVMIAFKAIKGEFERIFRPNVVNPTRVGSTVLDAESIRSVLIYVVLFVFLFWVGAVAIKVLEPAGSLSFVSAATASLATLANVGPGLEAVGAVENYGFFSSASKLVMILLMALGRLEIFCILVLLMPRFWRET